MTTNDHYLLAVHKHERSVPACAAKLVDIARKVSDASTTISDFVEAIVTGTPVYAIPKDSKQLARYCARQLKEQAASRRKTLLRFEGLEDGLTHFRLTWWGR